MAQPNYTPIQLYHSTTAAAVPTAANLAQGELAINITDGKLYYEDGSGVVQVIASKGAGTIGGSTTQIQYNNAGALAGSSAMVFNNSTNVVTLTTLNLTNALGAVYGGTGQSTYTTGDLLYSSAANTLSKLAIGTANYILTVNSGGTNVQWSAPSSISVSTATNLAGGVAGSVPYQSGASTTTFLAIGAADRVMTSSGSAPQWVTALTGLTGVSSSSITNTSLTSTRVVYSGASGLQTNSANLTFDGTTLTTAGLSNSGTSALVKLVTVGNTSFNGTTVFAPATPAKLYMGTGTVTDVTSAVSQNNTYGAIMSLGITPIAASQTGVTYTNAATLYIDGAPSNGTNVLITNPYALYVAAGASYLGGNTAVTGTLSATGVATFSAGTAALPAITTTGDTNTGIWFPAADTIAFTEGGVECARFDSSGNFGLGTTAPATLFHMLKDGVGGSAPNQPELRIQHNDINAISTGGSNGGILGFVNLQVSATGWAADSIWGRINFSPSQPTSGTAQLSASILAAAEGALAGQQTPTYLAFYTSDSTNGGNNGEKMRLTSGGNLGLGVTPNTTSLGGTYSLLAAGKASGSGIIMGQTDLTAADSTAAQFLGKTTGASGYQLLGGMLVQTDGSSTTNAVGRLTFYTATGGSLGERARINSDGRFQIASTNNTGANTKLVVGTGNTGTNGITIVNTGDTNVDALVLSNWSGSTTSNGPRISFDNSGRAAWVIGAQSAGTGFDLCQTWGTPYVRITSNGNFGIGTTSPDTYGKLAVNSTAAAGANVAITKENSGSANQNGQVLYFNNSHPSATARNSGVVAGQIVWQFSQPSSGALQYAGEIAVLADVQTGLSTASSLRLYSSGGLGITINSSANTVIAGALSKASGSFRIDHPLPELEETHQLVHSFIEGPQADLIYRGKVNLVNGTATVNIDTVSTMTEGTFVILCRDVQCFTTNESDWTAVRGSVTGNILTIEAEDNTSTASISWMVIGERKDKHMMVTDWTDDNGKVIVEPLKEQSSTALEGA